MTNSALLSSLQAPAGPDTLEVSRGWLGVGIGNMPHGQPQGAVVCRVQPGSPAEAAGLQPNDLLMSLNGQSITDATHLKETLDQLSVGARIQLVLTRKGHEQALELALGKQP